MQTQTYVYFILAIAPLLVVGLGLRAYDYRKSYLPFAISAISFAIAFVLPPSRLAGFLVFPWLIFTLYLLSSEGLVLWHQLRIGTPSDRNVSRLLLAAFVYLPVGAAWAFADRWGLRPMGFTPIIVLLTGVHFHYAGFALPLISGFLLEHTSKQSPAWNKGIKKYYRSFLSWGVVLGVPLVALGITSSQYDWPVFIEITAVTIMASAGLGVGLGYLGVGWQQSGWQQFLFLLGGFALASGMCLALLYGWRYVMPLSFLSIPWMYAVHGSLNSLGFVLPVLLAWNFRNKLSRD